MIDNLRNVKAHNIIVMSAIILLLTCGLSRLADSEELPMTNYNNNRIVVFPIYAEEVLLQLIQPTDLVFVGHKYLENASEYYPTMELTKDIPGGEYLNTDIHDIFNSMIQPTLIIIDDIYRQAFEYQYADIPEIAKGYTKTIFVKSPERVSDITDLIIQLGRSVNEEIKADQMIRDFNAEYAQIVTAATQSTSNRRVKSMYYERFQKSFSMLSDSCNMINIFQNVDYLSDEDYQSVSSLNPDIIFFCPIQFDTDGSLLYTDRNYSDRYYNHIRKETLLQETNAIKNEKIYPLFLHQSQYYLDDIRYILSLLSHYTE